MSWPLVQLSDVAFFQEGPGVRKWQFRSEGVKLINVKNIVDEVLVTENSDKYLDPDEVEQKYSHFLTKVGDLVMASSGATWGKLAWVEQKHLPLCMNTSMIRFQSLDSEKLDIRYLFYYLKTVEFRRDMEKLVTGSAQPNFGSTHLKQISLPLPPIEVQKRIAAILDKADAIRQKRKQAIDLADEFLHSVFLDMFGDPVTNPKGWEIKTIGELATKVTDGEHQTPKREEKGYKLLSARNVQHGFLDVENEKVDFVGEAEFQRITKRLSISKSDVLLSCSGTIGRVSMNTLNEPFCLVRSVAVIRLADNEVIPEFLVGYLGTSAMQTIMKKEANSSGQPNLFQNQIKKLKVLVPPLELQANYGRFLDHYKEKKASLISASEQQALLFKSLSQKAFSGQL